MTICGKDKFIASYAKYYSLTEDTSNVECVYSSNATVFIGRI